MDDDLVGKVLLQDGLIVSTLIMVVMTIAMMVKMMNFITRTNMSLIEDDDDNDDDDDIRRRVQSKEWSALLLKLPSPQSLQHSLVSS